MIMKLPFRKEFGNEGEALAKKFLKKKGLKFIEKNFVYHKKEIDLIFLDKKKNILVFVEVKSRHNTKYGLPEDSIHYFKQKNIKFAAEGYLLIHPEYRGFDIRMDSVSVLIENGKTTINHIENSF
jgi:putative endonuclease